MSLRLAILASGNGSNFQAIYDSIDRGVLDAEIKVLLCNHHDAYVVQRAKNLGIPFFVYESDIASTRAEFDAILVDTIQQFDIDIIALAGYMRILSPIMIQAFKGKILNIHPSILPAFKGIHSIREAQEWGVKVTGCSVHFVDEKVDHGSIIIQAVVPVFPEEPLEALQKRIHQQEYRIYPQALQWIAQKRLYFCEDMRTVYIKPDHNSKPIPFSQDIYIYPPLEEGF